ncbi:hypothetical protein O4J56_03990 [Nocardiopsis sp. RSe5-2]|uniref:Uncharacterized protein n=1 Tax=Nocardiopsis endophytica TaxID=3018445 RepID=A0ABT4TYL7_9ACTN|nr:hypothetical protein [Nocardiopsis endophytica]MDA2809791.1 hypothetical protein [Nocardiopsis endophytica]
MSSRPSAVAVVAAVVFAATAACSPDQPAGSSAEEPTDGSQASASSPEDAAAPSPSPTGPCAEGTCEIEVSEGDTVAVPQEFGLGPIEVTAVADDAVEMAAPLTGSGYSISGCSGGGGVTSQGGGGVSLSCEPGTVATVNDAMTLEVVEVGDGTAVLRIEPAE